MEFSWQIGGRAGDGIDTAGEMFALALARSGFEVFTYRVYPSRIRGGYTSYKIRIRDKRTLSRGDDLKYLVAFDQEAIDMAIDELAEGGAILYDTSFEAEVEKGVHLYGLPMGKIASEIGAKITKNVVSLGATAGLLDMGLGELEGVVRRRFSAKPQRVVDMNLKALKRGRAAAGGLKKADVFVLKTDLKEKRYLLSGDEAVALGAIAGGCRFYSAYPITPATYIMEYLCGVFSDFGGVVVQAEDEIAAVNMAIGANFAGVRGMTATSGPGISLMSEAISLAGMTETPLVIVDGQRPGPATGMPTKHEQGDLGHLVYGCHGDFPRIVLSPGDVEEVFYLVAKAFNLAERYQCPVIVAIDHGLAVSRQTVDGLDFKVEIDRGEMLDEKGLEYRRFAFTESGVSPRTVPGQRKGVFMASSDEHHETGHISEDPLNRVKMMQKRMRKLKNVQGELEVKVYGDGEADIAIVGVGGAKGAIIEALEELEKEGIKLKYVQPLAIYPPPEGLKRTLEGSRKIIVVEHNFAGQLARILKAELGVTDIKNVLKYDGTPFKPMEVYNGIKEAL